MKTPSPGEIVHEVAAQVKVDYPGGHALILTGSAARDEATYLETSRGTLWLSDLEFLVVVPNSADPARELFALDALAGRIAQSLQEAGVTVSVELTPTFERYFPAVRPHLFGYELRTHGKQLYGEHKYLNEIPRFDWREIRLPDAWFLLSNRMLEWLDFLLHGHAQPAAQQFYVLTKLYLDLATSLSFFSGHYHPTYRGRAAVAGEIAAWSESQGAPLPAGPFAEAVRIASEFKTAPQAIYDRLLRNGGGDLYGALERGGWSWICEQLRPMMMDAWRWELSRLAGRPINGADSALRAMRKVYSRKHRAAGWVRMLQRPHFRAGGAFFSRAPRLAPLGPPRALVYACAETLLQFQSSRDPLLLDWVRKRLPVLYTDCGTWDGLAAQCVRNWKVFLRREYL